MIPQIKVECQELILRHIGGATHAVEVLGAEAGNQRELMVRWDMDSGYTVELATGSLIRIKGGRIVKRFLWKVADLDGARALWARLRQERLAGYGARAKKL